VRVADVPPGRVVKRLNLDAGVVVGRDRVEAANHGVAVGGQRHGLAGGKRHGLVEHGGRGAVGFGGVVGDRGVIDGVSCVLGVNAFKGKHGSWIGHLRVLL